MKKIKIIYDIYGIIESMTITRRKRKGIKSLFEEIMTENFSNLKKETDNLQESENDNKKGKNT